MQTIDAEQIDAALTPPALIAALREGFQQMATIPLRHHHKMQTAAGDENVLLLMPAWNETILGVKCVTVCPANASKGQPGVQGSYLLFDAATGAPKAVLDGTRLTQWRTAAASALAADYLARTDTQHLVLVGAGGLAPYLARSHGAVRPIKKVTIWNRTTQRAEHLAHVLRQGGLDAASSDDLEAACRDADIISCATGATQPLVRGQWLTAGTHVDLVGAFTPKHREVDDDTLRNASLFVDVREGAVTEAGDIVQAIASGAISKNDIRADLAELACGAHGGRSADDEITVFKSVGTALEDLVAAQYVMTKLLSG